MSFLVRRSAPTLPLRACGPHPRARAWLTELTDPLQRADQPLDALATELVRGRRARRATGAADRDSRTA